MANPQSYSFIFRILIIACAILFCFLSAGVVFGYSPLKSVMLQSGVYQDLCDKDHPQCNQQKLRLDLMFTIAASATNISALFMGYILDTFGPKVASLCGSVLVLFGGLLFGYSYQSHLDYYIPAYTLLGVGGPFIFMSSIHLSVIFPTRSGLVMSLLTGAFDASSIIYFFFLKLYENGLASISTFFFAYSIVPLMIMIYSFIMMPRSSFSHETNVFAVNRRRRTGNPLKDLKYQTLWNQIASPVFILLLVFLCIFMLRLNFYIATVDDQLKALLKGDSDRLSRFFGLMLPLGGAISIPPTAILLDKAGFHITFIVLYVLSLLFGILSLIPNVFSQYLSITIFVVMRPLLYTAANDFSAKTFGFDTFGKVFGLITLLSGLFNMLQSTLNSLTRQTFSNNFLPVNVALTICSLILCAFLPVYVLFMTYRADDVIVDDSDDDLDQDSLLIDDDLDINCKRRRTEFVNNKRYENDPDDDEIDRAEEAIQSLEP